MLTEICSRPWKFAVAPFRVIGNVYYVGNSNVSSHLIDTGDGLILLDTAFPQTVYLLLESIRRLGFDPVPVAIVDDENEHQRNDEKEEERRNTKNEVEQPVDLTSDSALPWRHPEGPVVRCQQTNGLQHRHVQKLRHCHELNSS